MKNKIKNVFIVLSTILGTIATILGIVAVFYPDLLNLEKNQIKSFSMESKTEKDAQALDKFLEENKNKIVKLEISVCSIIDSKCPLITTENNHLSFKAFMTDDNDNEICNIKSLGEGIAFYFSKSDNDNNVWGWEKHAECSNNNHFGLYIVDGYFLVPEVAGWGMGWTEWMLTPIPKKDIELKKY
jgi:hypothetical protein